MYKNLAIVYCYLELRTVSILVLMDLCIKTALSFRTLLVLLAVSILVLMDLCIKTNLFYSHCFTPIISFNPCFNGSMYKNHNCPSRPAQGQQVSILVLMDLCIKTIALSFSLEYRCAVSILVLMDLCIKTFNTVDINAIAH